MAAIKLKDLLQAQRQLKQGESEQERMTIEQFRAMTAAVDDNSYDPAAAASKIAATKLSKRPIQPTEIVAQESNEILKKGLLDQQGEGLNSNVIKLTDELKKQTKLKVKQASSSDNQSHRAHSPAGDRVARDATDILEQRSQQQAARYVPGTKDWIKQNVGFNMPTPGSGLKGWRQAINEMFSLDSLLDMSDGKNVGGLFGGQLRRKVEENRYVKDRMDTEKGRMLNLPKYQGEQGRKKAEQLFRQQYREQTNIRGGIADNEKRIAELRDRGFSDADLKRAGLYRTREQLDEKLRTVDVQYRDQRKQDPDLAKSQATTRAFSRAASINPQATLTPLTGTVSGLVGASEEVQQETAHTVDEQTSLLRKIEQNTDNTNKLLPKIGKQQPQPDDQLDGQRQGSKGSLVDDITGTIADTGGIKQIAKGAGSLVGKVGNFLGTTKGAGIAGGVVSGISGAVTAYQQWNDADDKQAAINADIDQKLASGEITKEQAEQLKADASSQSVQNKGAAVGAGAGEAIGGTAGAILGSAVGPLGTIAGGYLGSKAGKFLGEGIGKYGVKAAQSISSFFTGNDKATPVAKAPVSMLSPGYGSFAAQYGNQIAVGAPVISGALPQAAKADTVTSSSIIPRSNADAVYRQSGENAGAIAQPTIISAPTTVVAPTTNNQQVQNIAQKGGPRNTESSWQAYNRSRFAF